MALPTTTKSASKRTYVDIPDLGGQHSPVYPSSKPLPERKATITTDSEKLYAILTNLVKNAIKYTEKEKVGYMKKSPVFEFYVRDTGMGIPSDRLEAIFRRFVQADIEDTMARQGAGLGLAISKAYIEMLAETWG